MKAILKPKISVIVPFYNGEKFIEKCVNSLLNQDINSNLYELIFVDNNSTDKSVELLSKYSRIKVLRESKKGSYAARNCGIKAANGEVFAFIDVDCIAEPNWLRNALNEIVKTKDKAVVAGAVEFIDNNVSSWGIFDTTTFLNQEHASKGGSAVTANLIVPRNILFKVGLFNDTLQSGGDVEWTKRCFKKNYSIIYSAMVKVYHPIRNTFKEVSEKCYRVGYGNGQLIKSNQRYYALIKPSMVIPIVKSFSSKSSPINSGGYGTLEKIKLIYCSLILQYFNYKGKIKAIIK